MFESTDWSAVLTAGDAGSPASVEALGKLYSQYAFPLYCYLRRSGREHHDSEDLLQAFFERIISKGIFSGVVRERGRFRAFLLTSLKNFSTDDWGKERALRRGGPNKVPLSLNTVSPERYAEEKVNHLTPERLFIRRWIGTLLEMVISRLEKECREDGTLSFEALKEFLLPLKTPDGGYADLAQRLGTTEGAIRVAVHRLRKRYHALFREEVLRTLASPEELEDEVRFLLDALED